MKKHAEGCRILEKWLGGSSRRDVALSSEGVWTCLLAVSIHFFEGVHDSEPKVVLLQHVYAVILRLGMAR